MSKWTCNVAFKLDNAKILVTDEQGTDLLKARLPTPGHPRAILGLMEGLSLWCQSPLSVALSADDSFSRRAMELYFGNDFWPTESALVQFRFVQRVRRGRPIEGLGDFRDLYAMEAYR